tara:strand:+ start:2711 stop:2992 length:282 start_codon:yes stop_codon:yes gene_type:complete
MEFKTESGKKVVLKDVSIDDRDMLLDSVEYQYNEDGTVGNVKMMNTTITKWLRTCIDGDTSDKFLKTLTVNDRTEMFLHLQEYLLLGEKKASK